MKFRIFISSVQQEFAEERRMLAEYIRRDPLLGVFFEVFLFEETPACDVAAPGVYLPEVGASDIYLGLLGAEYGNARGGGGTWAAPIAGLLAEKYCNGEVKRKDVEKYYREVEPCQKLPLYRVTKKKK